MPGSWPDHELPYLDDTNCRETSLRDTRYNCIAWAAENNSRWWWPDNFGIGYWPPNVPREESIDAFMKAYETLGYKLCYNESLEPGLDKIAIYGIRYSTKVVPTHAARQMESGEWTSKVGPFEDISHKTLDAVNGPVYGEMICCMSRPR
jgi:hypothetical protein